MVWVLVIVVSVGCCFLLRFLVAVQMELQSPERFKLVRLPILIDDPSQRPRIHLAKARPTPQQEEPCETYSFSASR